MGAHSGAVGQQPPAWGDSPSKTGVFTAKRGHQLLWWGRRGTLHFRVTLQGWRGDRQVLQAETPARGGALVGSPPGAPLRAGHQRSQRRRPSRTSRDSALTFNAGKAGPQGATQRDPGAGCRCGARGGSPAASGHGWLPRGGGGASTGTEGWGTKRRADGLPRAGRPPGKQSSRPKRQRR